MSMQVYVAYSGREDQILALRLQTLAPTRPGLQVYVPPASTRSRRCAPTGIDLQQLNKSDLVLAVINGPVSACMRQEIVTAHRMTKPIIPFVWGRKTVTGLNPALPIFYVDPSNPIEAETKIIDYLSGVQIGKVNQQLLLALVLLLIGMLILAKE